MIIEIFHHFIFIGVMRYPNLMRQMILVKVVMMPIPVNFTLNFYSEYYDPEYFRL